MSRLLVDAMCGDLLAYLRMCGHDAAYAPDRGLEADDELLAAADAEERTIVTRDRQLAARADRSVLLEARDTEAQLGGVLDAGVTLELSDEPERCGQCNGVLARVPEGTRTAPYAPAPDEAAVWICEDCGQYFWCGSHWDRVAETLASVRGDAPGSA